MATPAKQDFCGHGFTMGFCPYSCTKTFYHDEQARERRAEFLKMFKKRDWKNPITKATIIHKLHQFHAQEQFLQMPINMIKIGNVRCVNRNEIK